MQYKKLLSLREARVNRLVDEAKTAEQEAKSNEQRNIREQILQK